MRFTLSARERNLVTSKDIGRLSTVSVNGWPHSIPVGYVYLDGKLYVPSSASTKKVRNLIKNAKATIVIDDELKEHGVMIECDPKILKGTKAEALRKYMRRVKGWQNDESTVIVELKPLRKASWFLKE